MLKRLRWLVTGFVLGIGSSWALLRRARRAVARYAPSEMVGRLGDSARTTRGDVRDAVAEGRAAMRAREAELRARFDRGGTAPTAVEPGAPRDGR